MFLMESNLICREFVPMLMYFEDVQDSFDEDIESELEYFDLIPQMQKYCK